MEIDTVFDGDARLERVVEVPTVTEKLLQFISHDGPRFMGMFTNDEIRGKELNFEELEACLTITKKRTSIDGKVKRRRFVKIFSATSSDSVTGGL